MEYWHLCGHSGFQGFGDPVATGCAGWVTKLR